MKSRAGTYRVPDQAKLGILKEVRANICTHFGIPSCLGTRECLISHRRLSGQSASTPFLPLSAKWCECCRKQCCFVGRGRAVFITLTYCAWCAASALINTTGVIDGAVLGDNHTLSMREPGSEKVDDGVDLTEN